MVIRKERIGRRRNQRKEGKGEGIQRKERRRLGKRRERYEEKLPYERWEGRERWKSILHQGGYRVKENQVERIPWLKARVKAHERELRYYERKPKTYVEVLEGREKGSGETKKEREEVRSHEKGSTSENAEEWGFWKTYEIGDEKRVLEWKKGILQKKQLGNRDGLGWDRSTYVEGPSGLNRRRSLTQNRRYLREKEKRERQERETTKRKDFVSSHPRSERSAERKQEKRRGRGYEDLQNPEKRDRSRRNPEEITEGRDWVNPVQRQRVWEELGNTMEGEFTANLVEEGKIHYGFTKKTVEKGKRERVREEREGREEQRQDPERSSVRKEERHQEKTRKAKRRKALMEKEESRKKKEWIWTPFGKRLRVHGWIQEGGFQSRSETEKKKERGRCRSG